MSYQEKVIEAVKEVKQEAIKNQEYARSAALRSLEKFLIEEKPSDDGLDKSSFVLLYLKNSKSMQKFAKYAAI